MKYQSVTAQQMSNLDDRAIRYYGIPSLCLMENAGRAVADEVMRVLRCRKKKDVCLFCGLGNNAGDGFVAARHLANQGLDVQIYVIGKIQKMKPDARVHYEALKKLKFNIKENPQITAPLRKEVNGCGCVVDALFGFGLNRPLKAPFDEVVTLINEEGAYVVAVDIPSGLDATKGHLYGVCVKANATVTLTLPKKGFDTSNGRRHTGRVKTVSIGIPQNLIRKYVR